MQQEKKNTVKAVKSKRKHILLALFKPYGVLSQFTREAGRRSLADLGLFPRNIYPVGRLDADSEGLLLLTNDNKLKTRLTDPKYAHPKTYLVQVEHIPTGEALRQLREGVILKGVKTRPADVRLLSVEPMVPPRIPPIRYRKSVPTAWIEITLHEGKNRQVRHMTAAVGHPTLRLVRIGIGKFSVEDLDPGQSRRLTADDRRLLESV